MTTTARPLGHKTLKLAQIAPAKSASFSPNLYRWMRAHAHFYKGGGVLQTVYRVKPDTKLAAEFGVDTLMVGYKEYPSEDGFSGVRLMAALCQGTEAGSFYYIRIGSQLAEVEDFWDSYLKLGRCAIDPDHEEIFRGDRFSMTQDTRTCLWCGAKQQRVLTPRTVFDESWKSL